MGPPGENVDAGLMPGADGGSSASDGGKGEAGLDAGITETACTLGSNSTITTIGPVLHQLDAFGATADRFAIAFRRISGATTTRTLRLAERGENPTELNFDLKSVSGSFIPVGLAPTATGVLLGGNDESSGSSVGTVAWIDNDANLLEMGTAGGRTVYGIVAEGAGARTVALSSGTPAKVVSDIFAADGTLDDTVELGVARRPQNQWALARRETDGRIFGCGYTTSGPSDFVTVYELEGSTATSRVTAQGLAPDPQSAEISRFACRIALGRDFSAVAVAETDGRPRLIWFGDDGNLLAGPVPFLPEHKTGTLPPFDVAVNGDNTAVAFFDNSTGASQLVVRVFSGPGFAPVSVDVSGDLNLGNFTVPRRVRLVNVGDGFAVAFEAPVGNKTDIHYRPVSCTP